MAEGAVDEIPQGPFNGVPLAIGGSFDAVINTGGDLDSFAVELVAGQSYVFTLTGSGASPLEDPFLQIFGDTTLILAIDDDGGPGRNSQLRFTAQETGTHYVTALAWDAYDAADGPPTLTGGYTITAATGPRQNLLDTIDLGFTLQTTNISVYFATDGETFDGVTASRSWTPAEIASALAAMATFSTFTPLTFTQVESSAGATFTMSLAELPPTVLGQFTSSQIGGFGVFDPTNEFWSPTQLQPGGEGFVTLIHEVGHGLGLAHPHDNGGVDPNNSSEIMEGILGPFEGRQTYDFNQAAFTIMSYMSTGREATPGPLDIALLQQKYGVITANAGDNIYEITDGEGNGTLIKAIWDTGGTDAITYSGARGLLVDLRPASLLNDPEGGGGFSRVSSLMGGFTIPNGVVIENATGGPADDRIHGNAFANILTAGGGDDWLWGGDGADTLVGGEGYDRVYYDDNPAGVNVNLLLSTAIDGWGATDTLSSVELIIGSSFDDVIIGSADAATFWGRDGDDYLVDNSILGMSLLGEHGNDTLIAGAGRTSLSGDLGDDLLIGGAGDNIYMWGGEGNDIIYGMDGNDALTGDSGGNGDDILDGGAGNDWLDGVGGADTASYADTTSGVVVNLALDGQQDTLGAGLDTLISIENLTGSSFNDTLIGNAEANILDGGDGNDTMTGGGGDDVLVGGRGGINVLNGGDGVDSLGLAWQTNALFVDLAAGAYAYAGGGWDALTSIEGAIGGAANDTIFGDANSNLLRGGQGSDTLVGRGGSDTLVGEAGDDWIVGEDGDDLLEGGAGINVLIGGAGTDLASYASQTASLWIDMPAGVYSAAGVWDVFFQSIEGVLGGSGNDSIFGNALDNTLRGGGGDDALIGGAGNDRLEGGTGFDWIVGGEGNDRLIGGEGVDVLTGGAGADTFDLGTAAGWDVAFDFNAAEDRFALGGLSWLGFLSIDADGDGQTDDTLLGYAGGNFVALNASGLSLEQWNALVDAPASAASDKEMMSDAEIAPLSTCVDPVSGVGPGFLPDLDPALGGLTQGLSYLQPHEPGGWGIIG